LAEERERSARGRQPGAEDRQAGHESDIADTGWEGRDVARLARKKAAELRADAAASRLRADAARRAVGAQYPLAARFAELAGHLFAAGQREEVLARILTAAVDVVDGADMASISLTGPGGVL